MIHWFLKTKNFIPDAFEKTVFDIDYKALKNKNIKVLFFDIDNTLIPYDLHLPNEALKHLFKTLKNLEFEVVFISNNHQKRIKNFSEPLNIPYIHSAKKPLKTGFKRAYLKLNTSVSKDEIMLIGDQIMTDVYGAKRYKINVTLVEPIKRKTEKWYTKFNRKIETKILQKIQKHYPDQYQALSLNKR